MSSSFVTWEGEDTGIRCSTAAAGLTVLYLSSSHLDGRGHRSVLAELDSSQHALPAVADVDVLIEDGLRDEFAVLRDGLQSQDCVLRDRQAERERPSGWFS